MPRIKEREKFIHEPSTHEIFICLASMPSWSTVLLENVENKDYRQFLNWLIEKNFFKGNRGKVTIKQMAAEFGMKVSKISNWLPRIYDDIIELNSSKPELFSENKPLVNFFFSYHDSDASINLGVDMLPREYEDVSFFFIKAKIGTNRFWVSKVEHEIHDEGVEITIWLEGGFLNKYRELAVNEALFKGWIGLTDQWEKRPFEIDEILLKHIGRFR